MFTIIRSIVNLEKWSWQPRIASEAYLLYWMEIFWVSLPAGEGSEKCASIWNMLELRRLKLEGCRFESQCRRRFFQHFSFKIDLLPPCFKNPFRDEATGEFRMSQDCTSRLVEQKYIAQRFIHLITMFLFSFHVQALALSGMQERRTPSTVYKKRKSCYCTLIK